MLKASSNQKITDDGIKDMQLHTLYASDFSKITDKGIKHMQLHTLNASYNSKITDKESNICIYIHYMQHVIQK